MLSCCFVFFSFPSRHDAAHTVHLTGVRLPNVLTAKLECITIPHIPAMKNRTSATAAEKTAVRLLRDELP